MSYLVSQSDFDHPPDRSGSDSLKWQRYAGRDVLPLWVADMDFATAPAIIEALQQRVQHGVFGYAMASDSLLQAACQMLQDVHGWTIEPDWLLPLPGLVSGLNIVCRATGNPGDAVMTAVPVYPPFLSAPRLAERRLIRVELQQVDGDWQWDMAALERHVSEDTRLLLLCHPHNPVGRVWSVAELQQLADFVCRHDLLVCSDEIHAGLVLEPGVQHVPLASLSPELAQRCITLIAPSKTYNLPGLGCAFAVVADPTLRRRLRRVMEGIVPHVNALGLTACEAAWRHGEPWRQALLDYLRHNRDQVVHSLHDFHGLRLQAPQATYLAWIDCRAAILERPAAFFEEAGVGLSDGAEFGAPGFVRLNFGCPASRLQEALARMRHALQR